MQIEGELLELAKVCDKCTNLVVELNRKLKKTKGNLEKVSRKRTKKKELKN